MYKVTKEVPKNFDQERYGPPVLCLADEYGGQSVIKVDDHCFVLMNGSEDREFVSVKHWYPEASNALQNFLNDNPGFVI